MVKQAAVVEETDDREKRGAREDAENLRQRHVVQSEKHSENEAQVDGDAAEQAESGSM